MEVMEKKPKSRKKREKSKPNDKLDIVPVASSSEGVDVQAELKNAAIDIVKNDVYFKNETSVNETETNEVDGLDDDETETKVTNEQVKREKLHNLSDSLEDEVIKKTEARDDLKTNEEVKTTIEKLYNLNESLKNEIKFNDLTEQLKALKHETPKEAIRAFTVSQLSALYTNTELNAIEQFTDDFVEAELKGTAHKHHLLYELLIAYLKVRGKMMSNNAEINSLRKDYEDLQSQLWTMDTSVVSEKGQCADGNIIMASYTFHKATFHHSAFKTTSKTLTKIRELTQESHKLYSYSVSVLKLQIELFIQDIIGNIMNLTRLSPKAPIYLGTQMPPPHLTQFLFDLRLCISILFLFQRKLIRDVEFIKETRTWLTQLVCVLLRLASWQDHLFLLNHVLRCPPGIGNWASCYIQVPLSEIKDSPFANYEINHTLTILALILIPVKKRELFLEDLSQKLDDGDNPWVLVDSDGEEDEDTRGTALRENDLVALLNQLPFDNLFRAILLIERKDNQDHYIVSKIDENHILRFFSFSTALLKIVHTGLHTYNQQRYQQFCKRLSRFIRHVIQYATDQWESFLKNDRGCDLPMIERLQVEYDALFLRAIYYLYTSEKMGAWQFLAVIPYNIVSLRTLWKIFYFLHQSDTSVELILDSDNVDYVNKIWDPSIRTQFEEKLGGLAHDECYYLLNTLANMALTRQECDMQFIETATMDLLQIGFICESTQETCSKNTRILLTHITSKHPHLLSDILKCVKENTSKIGTLCLYLYEELPISVWKLTNYDVYIISNMLLQNAITTDESKLARMILSRLNWEFDEEGKLFLPYSLHCDIAMIIAKAVEMDPGYLHWAWQTSFRLRLHISDKGFSDFQQVHDIEFYDTIYKAVQNQQPLGAFLSILISSWGHLIPLVVSKGMDQLTLLQTHQKHEAVLFAFNLIIPLFIHCQEALINLDKFQNILLGLLNADRTYINIAKSFVTTQSTVLEQFGNMIESQLANYQWYNLESPKYITRLWVNSLVSVPNWNRDYGVMYLLDVIIKAVFFHADSVHEVTEILRDLLQCATPQEQTNSISTLFKWVSQSNSSQNNLLINTSLSTCPYLAYVMIRIEFEEREKATGLWNEILIQIRSQKGKISVDTAIKKAASKLKLPSFSSGSLCFFRWAQQALDTPIEHPILILLWQNFFTLYLYYITLPGNIKRCVGEKFFDGMINFNFLKRLKKRLIDTVTYYTVKTTEEDFQYASSKRQLFYMSSLKVFTGFSLWLEEPRIQDCSLYLPGLPPQYEPHLLNLVLQHSESPWLEYVDYETMKEQQELSIKIWRSANYRERKNINRPLLSAGSRVESDDPSERIIRRLTSYDKPKLAPDITVTKPMLPPLNVSNRDDLFSTLQGYFKTLLQFAENHVIDVSSHTALDNKYQELLPQLYRSVQLKIVKKVPCSGANKTVHCTSPATIILQSTEAKLNEHIELCMRDNRVDYESFLSQLLKSPPQALCFASIVLCQVVKILQNMKEKNPEYSKLGVELFYHLLALLNEETTNYLPTKKLFTDCLEKLGQTHICGVEFETTNLLHKILENPSQGIYMAPHFAPVTAGTANILAMYEMVIKNVGHQNDVLFSLLSKFDINLWLQRNTPKLCQRSQFIQLVMKALISFGAEVSDESLALHEVFRKHLICIFEYQFPEHYGEILMHILKASNGIDSDCVSTMVWLDVLNSLSKPIKIEWKTSIRNQLRQYATQQQLLRYQELLDTTLLLSRHYTTERLHYGLYGLYPKTRHYIDVIVLHLGLTGHALIIGALNTHQGILGDKMCEIVWPYLRDMFAPWVVPYCANNLKDNMANWIQQLTDDRSVVLPWIPANAPFAQKVLDVFFECILFIIETLPACNNILSFVWQWYVTNFAYPQVKEHIFSVVHNSLLSLPWHKFWPSVADLDLMLRVVEQYLPESHAFLGQIFIEIQWKTWIGSLTEQTPMQIKSRVHHCMLHLLVKLSNEPNIKNTQSEKAKGLLVQAEYFDWNVLDSNSVQQVMDWYVMSCDPQVLFKTDPLNLDFRVFQFLKTVCYYTKPLSNPSSSSHDKRHIFVRTYVKLLMVHKSRQKSNGKDVDSVSAVKLQLNHLESIVTTQDEMNVLLGEFLNILNQERLKISMIECFDQWFTSRKGNNFVIIAALDSLGKVVTDPDVLAVLYETCLRKFHCAEDVDNPKWTDTSVYLKAHYTKPNLLIDSAILKGCVFTLHVLLLHKTNSSFDLDMLLTIALKWVSNVKVTDRIESKMPLLWDDYIKVALKFAQTNESAAASYLNRFAQHLLQNSEQKEGNKWGSMLGAIGIGKQTTVTLQFKFVCRALAGYILAQLPEPKGNPAVIRLVVNAPCTVGQPGGNGEVAKILLKLDFGQSNGQIKECAEYALKKIQDPNNSMHNINVFLNWLLLQFFPLPFLRDIG